MDPFTIGPQYSHVEANDPLHVTHTLIRELILNGLNLTITQWILCNYKLINDLAIMALRMLAMTNLNHKHQQNHIEQPTNKPISVYFSTPS